MNGDGDTGMHSAAYITNIAYYLPELVVECEVNRLTRKTGIRRRHVVTMGETAADLAVKAAEKIFLQGIDRATVDFVLLCTQSPDYFLPTTACLIQDRLGLSRSCGALDFNLGCSGYIYGLSLAKGLVETGQAKRVLLLTSETYSKYLHPQDGSVATLFGDAATATLIDKFDADKDQYGMYGFSFGTDGSGGNNLIVPVGGARHPYDSTAVENVVDKYGNFRTNRNIYMNGSAISEFALDVVPSILEDVLDKTCLHRKDVNYFVFHQANKFILEYLQQKCGLQDCFFWNNVSEYANTVSNSVPIALCDILFSHSDISFRKFMLVGFGVGLSWAGCMVDLHHCKAFR
jgi:3-oxoacyl-[acyl-carrier-protein] synthase-3